MEFLVKKYTAGSITMEYMEGGVGETILFLPGGIRSGVYEEVITLLSEKYHVLIPDLPGFGNATVPKEVWGFEDYADFFITFLEKHSLEHITVIGHSLGGGTGLVMARKSTRIKQLIIFGSAGITPPFSKLSFFYRLFIKKTIYDMVHARSFLSKAILLNNAVSTVVENGKSVFHLARIAEKCIYQDIDNLDHIRIPVSLLWGDKDELFPLSCAKKMKMQIPHAHLEIVDGNHDWCVLHAKKSTALAIQYIR